MAHNSRLMQNNAKYRDLIYSFMYVIKNKTEKSRFGKMGNMLWLRVYGIATSHIHIGESKKPWTNETTTGKNLKGFSSMV